MSGKRQHKQYQGNVWHILGYERFSSKDERRARNDNTSRCQNEGKRREWIVGNATHSIDRDEEVERATKAAR